MSIMHNEQSGEESWLQNDTSKLVCSESNDFFCFLIRGWSDLLRLICDAHGSAGRGYIKLYLRNENPR